MDKVTYIPGEIANAAIDEHGNRKPVTRTQHIFDDVKGKRQSEVNEELEEAVGTVDEKITAEKTRAEGVEGGLNTRLQTVEQLAEISIGGGEAQIATGADFTNPDATKRAKVPTVGAIVDGLNDGIYDVSKRNPTAGPNSDGKFTLDYILSNADTLIPTGWRHGGMTISFVDSSDNKYMQYRLMSDTFSTTESDWQGVSFEDDIFENLNTAKRNQIPTVGVISDNFGKYIQGTEFLHVYFDENDKILFGLKRDGDVYFGVGVPQQIIAYLKPYISSITNKQNKEEGKGLILTEFANNISYIDGAEFICLYKDADNKIVYGIKKDASVYFAGDITICGQIYNKHLKNQISNILTELERASYFSSQNKSGMISVLLDASNKGIISIDESGKVDIPFFSSASVYNDIKRANKNVEESLKQYIESSKYIDVICCDGDSLTYGDLGAASSNSQAQNNYPKVLQKHLGTSFKVNNYGNRGAPSPTILNNAVGYKIMEDITIPSDRTPVIFEVNMIKDSTNVESYTFAPTRASENVGTNPCYINSIKGYLDSVTVDGIHKAKFTRTLPGESKNISAGEIIYTSESLNNRNATHIILMGANRGFIVTGGSTADSVNELIKQYKCIVNTSSDLYICMLYWGFEAPYETMFENAFGEHFLNLRAYLSTDAIDDALDRGYLVNEDPEHPTYPTAEDVQRMAQGKVPTTLLASDGIHMTDVGYHLIGDLVYKKYQDMYKYKVTNNI